MQVEAEGRVALVTGAGSPTGIEVASRGVTVNSVQPGFVATRSQTADEQQAGEHTPVGRSGTPEEIGQVIAFPASDRASYVTGQPVVVDGGNVIQELKGS